MGLIHAGCPSHRKGVVGQWQLGYPEPKNVSSENLGGDDCSHMSTWGPMGTHTNHFPNDSDCFTRKNPSWTFGPVQFRIPDETPGPGRSKKNLSPDVRLCRVIRLTPLHPFDFSCLANLRWDHIFLLTLLTSTRQSQTPAMARVGDELVVPEKYGVFLQKEFHLPTIFRCNNTVSFREGICAYILA